MYSKKFISRKCLIFLLTSLISWGLFGYIAHYERQISNNDCLFAIKDLTQGILVFTGIGSIVETFYFGKMLYIFLDYEHLCELEIIDMYKNTTHWMHLILLLFSVSGVIGFVEFCLSGLFHYNIECKTDDAKKTFIFSMIYVFWIGIIFITLVSFLILSVICKTLFKLIKASFFDKNNITQPIDNDKEIQVNHMICVPIDTIENKPYICLTCLENQLDLICLPCNHMCICSKCFKNLSNNKCPYCNRDLTGSMNVYICGIENV